MHRILTFCLALAAIGLATSPATGSQNHAARAEQLLREAKSRADADTYREAISGLEEAIKLEPKWPELHRALGYLYLREFRVSHDASLSKKAVESLVRSIELGGENATARYYLG